MLTADIRELVEHACAQEKCVFGAAFFDEHVAVVAECATALATPLGADREAVELAAYLHDIAAVCDASTLPRHAAMSAELAGPLLEEQGCARERAELVGLAIALHSEPIAVGSAAPEAVALASADAASRILRPAYWLWFAFSVRKLGFAEGREWLRGLVERQWAAMVEPARDLVGAQYGATLALLGGVGETR
jgi:HD superfamily phosphodiesterase